MCIYFDYTPNIRKKDERTIGTRIGDGDGHNTQSTQLTTVLSRRMENIDSLRQSTRQSNNQLVLNNTCHIVRG